jgi:chromate transporter
MGDLLKFFWVFFKIGSFTFGGGLAMLPLIEREIVTNNRWMTKEEFIDTIAITQCMPGVIAVNAAIYLGYNLFGFWGAIIGSLGAIIPSFLIMLLAATFFLTFKEQAMVQSVLGGIRPAVAVLIFSAAVRLAGAVDKNVYNLFVALASVVLISLLGVHPIWVIIGAALLRILWDRRNSGNADAE